MMATAVERVRARTWSSRGTAARSSVASVARQADFAGRARGSRTCPGGPLVRQSVGRVGRLASASAIALDALKREYAERRRLVLRVAPGAGRRGLGTASRRTASRRPGSQARSACQSYRSRVRRHRTARSPTCAPGWRRSGATASTRLSGRSCGSSKGSGTSACSTSSRRCSTSWSARKSFAAPLGPDFHAELQKRLPAAGAPADRDRLGRGRAGRRRSSRASTATPPSIVLGASNDAGPQAQRGVPAAVEGDRGRGGAGLSLVRPRRRRRGEATRASTGSSSGLGGSERVTPGPYDSPAVSLRWTAVRAAERAFRVVSTVRLPR